jgi:hypothetical protein
MKKITIFFYHRLTVLKESSAFKLFNIKFLLMKFFFDILILKINFKNKRHYF